MVDAPALRVRSPALDAPLRRVGLVLHPDRDTGPVVGAVRTWAQARAVEVLRAPSWRSRDAAAGTEGLPLLDGPVSALDLVLAVGGDGTMLGALRLAVGSGVPVLGIAHGHLGYLTEAIADRCPDVLDELDAGQHIARQLLALRGRAVRGAEAAPAIAVNDIVLSRTPGAGQAILAIEVGGEPYIRCSADALIVASPLGSTAYSLSAGGPLAFPELDLLLVTAVAPQGVFDRTLLVPATDAVVVEVLERSAPIAVEADGQVVDTLHPHDRYRIEVAQERTTIIRLDGTSFYSRVRSRLAIPDAPVLAGEGSRTRGP